MNPRVAKGHSCCHNSPPPPPPHSPPRPRPCPGPLREARGGQGPGPWPTPPCDMEVRLGGFRFHVVSFKFIVFAPLFFFTLSRLPSSLHHSPPQHTRTHTHGTLHLFPRPSTVDPPQRRAGGRMQVRAGGPDANPGRRPDANPGRGPDANPGGGC